MDGETEFDSKPLALANCETYTDTLAEGGTPWLTKTTLADRFFGGEWMTDCETLKGTSREGKTRTPDCRKIWDALGEGETARLTDGETLWDRLVEGKKLRLTNCKELRDTLVEVKTLRLTELETLT